MQDQSITATFPHFPEQQQLKCPRCDSLNTKFCYYNNYNLSQPRHFCKNCRRYWTKGGTLRNIPVGGGSRKHTKQRSLAASVASSQQQESAVLSSLGSGLGIQNPNSIPAPVPTAVAGMTGVGTASGVPPPVESFTSLLTDGEFDNLADGSGQSSFNGYLMSGNGGNCWGSSNISWTDLAMYTPSSKLQ